MVVDVREVEVQAGDLYLLCSDGLFSVVTDDQIAEIMADRNVPLEQLCQRLIDAAFRSIGLEPVDVFMDERALRAHPQAAPFDWSVEGKRNVVATLRPPAWSPTRSTPSSQSIGGPARDRRVYSGCGGRT